jgi:hypothetical protein
MENKNSEYEYENEICIYCNNKDNNYKLISRMENEEIEEIFCSKKCLIYYLAEEYEYYDLMEDLIYNN